MSVAQWMEAREYAVVDEIPELRAYHAGAILGPGLFIHGGQSGEGTRTLSDWNLFDLGLQVWVKCEVTLQETSTDGAQLTK